MKKTALLLSLSCAILSNAAQADTLLGLYLGADGWRTSVDGSFANTDQLQAFNFDDKTQTSYYVALEHPLPLIPNIRIQRNKLESSGSTLLGDDFSFDGSVFTNGTQVQNQTDITSTDYVLYYEVLDNELFSVDLGINGKYLDGSIAVSEAAIADGIAVQHDFSQWVPMLYGAVRVGLPLTGFDVFAQGSFVSYDGSQLYDAQAGIAYALLDNLAVDMTLKLGYRQVDLQLDDVDNVYTDLSFKGLFAGVEVHF